jgi:hypothetical protein
VEYGSPVQRVWGIGLTRTGTSSLNRALLLLGIKAVHWPTTRDLLYSDLDAATDESVSVVYKYLDCRCPGSKFILTERDEDDWLRSTAAHRQRQAERRVSQLLSSSDPTRVHHHDVRSEPREAAGLDQKGRPWIDRSVEVRLTQMTLYETLAFDEHKFRAGYRRFHADVERYFANRPNDLLRLRICDGEGWSRLAPFLGHAVPDAPFPHENRTT